MEEVEWPPLGSYVIGIRSMILAVEKNHLDALLDRCDTGDRQRRGDGQSRKEGSDEDLWMHIEE